jgi:pyruvate ferredoxin oxidoreductase alpha subunit
MGTLGKELEVAVDNLRKEGINAGSMYLRWFRPFPEFDLSGRDVVVIDRDYSFGFGGVLAQSIQAKNRIDVFSVIAGLGGQEVTYDDIASFMKKPRISEEYWFGTCDSV